MPHSIIGVGLFWLVVVNVANLVIACFLLKNYAKKEIDFINFFYKMQQSIINITNRKTATCIVVFLLM
jgi:hypothetical protein